MSRVLSALASQSPFAMFRMPGGLNTGSLRIEILAGLTVALALVPEAVALPLWQGCTRS